MNATGSTTTGFSPMGSEWFGPLALRLIGNTYCTVHKQFRFPRSKRGRIHRKWTKNPGNSKDVPNPHLYHMPKEGVIVGHPSLIDKLKRECSMKPSKD